MGERRRLAWVCRCVFFLKLRCQPKVQYLDTALRRDLHIGRLQIPVDDAFLMCGFQPFSNLAADTQSLID
jgi:hypothetical protein